MLCIYNKITCPFSKQYVLKIIVLLIGNAYFSRICTLQMYIVYMLYEN